MTIIINFLDAVYHKGGNLLNNIIFIILFPLLFLPLINLSFTDRFTKFGNLIKNDNIPEGF